MNDVKLTNIPSMTIEKAIENGLPIKTIPSVMLCGHPNVGKSQAIRRIAKKLRQAQKKLSTCIIILFV